MAMCEISMKWVDINAAPGVIACRHGLHGLQFEPGPKFLTCLQIVGTGVKNMFDNLVPNVMGEKYVREFGPNLYGSKIVLGFW